MPWTGQIGHDVPDRRRTGRSAVRIARRSGGGRMILAVAVIAILLLGGVLPPAMGTDPGRLIGGWLRPPGRPSAERYAPRRMEQGIAKGVFLVAEPRLLDPNFSQSVVLVLRHGQAGTVGVVINRPTTTRLARLLPDIQELKNRPDILYLGGPVSHDALVVLLRTQDRPPSAAPILEDVYFSRSVDELTDVLKKAVPTDAFRIYAGYAGWAPGQLEAELIRGDWRVIQGDPGAIFEKDPEEVWPEMIRRSSRQFINEKRLPTDPWSLGTVH